MTTRHPVHELPGNPLGDDFTLIRGIGPGISNRLHAAGILRFTQLASLSPEEIVAATGELIGLTIDRVAQQDWAGQARKMADAPPEQAAMTSDAGDHLHYATFTVELLLDEENHVRRTRLADVRATIEEAWAGWDADRLALFLAEHAGLQLEPPPTALEPELETTSAAEVQAATEPQADLLTGQMELHNLAATHPTSMLKHILPSDHSFGISLTLNLSEVKPPKNLNLQCHTVIQAKELSTGTRIILAEWEQEIETMDEILLKQEYPGLPTGTYRMEAASVLRSAGTDTEVEPQLSAFLEGDLLQVF